MSVESRRIHDAGNGIVTTETNIIVDFNSLHDAMQDKSLSTPLLEASSDSSGLFSESIEMVTSDVGTNTPVEQSDQIDTAHPMDNIGRTAIETCASLDSHVWRNAAPIGRRPSLTPQLEAPLKPVFIRVLYMGAASDKDKQLFSKKIAEGLSEIFHQNEWPDGNKGHSVWSTSHSASSCSTARTLPGTFKERKHHLTVVRLQPDDTDHAIVETCQDYGVSIIEADFTWPMDISDGLVLRYVWHQCRSTRQDPATWAPPSLSRYLSLPDPHQFDNSVYPDKTPNGVDLCVYFYDGDHPNEQHQQRVREDMMTLWQLKRLAIPILPIISMYRTPHHQRLASRLFECRAILGDLFAQHKISTIHVSNLDVGQVPFFQKRKPPSVGETVIELRIGKGCAKSSETQSPPNQVLTIDQFALIDRKNTFDLLRTARQHALAREEVHALAFREQGHTNQLQMHPPDRDNVSSPAFASGHRDKPHGRLSRPRVLCLLCVMLGLVGFWLTCHTQRWTASFHVAQEDLDHLGFHLEVRNPAGSLAWLPDHIVPTIQLTHYPTTFFMTRSFADRRGIYQFTVPKTIYHCVSANSLASGEHVEASAALMPPLVSHVSGSPIYFVRPLCPPPPPSPLTPTTLKTHLERTERTIPLAIQPDTPHDTLLQDSSTSVGTTSPTIAMTTAATVKHTDRQSRIFKMYRKMAYLIGSWEAILNLGFTDE